MHAEHPQHFSVQRQEMCYEFIYRMTLRGYYRCAEGRPHVENEGSTLERLHTHGASSIIVVSTYGTHTDVPTTGFLHTCTDRHVWETLILYLFISLRNNSTQTQAHRVSVDLQRGWFLWQPRTAS